MTQNLDTGMSVVRRWQLAAALRQFREQADLTQEQAVELLRSLPGHWSRSKLSRVENREHHVKPREVEQLLDTYGVTDAATRDELVALAAQPRERAWWEGFGKILPGDLQSLLSLEAGLVAMRDFQSQLVHGLLQTADYTRALVTSIHPGRLDPGELERRVAARMARHHILARDDPPALHFILDETILHRLIGDRIVMHGQLRKLLTVAERPNVTMQVLPRDVGGSPGLNGPFTILTLPDPIPDIGHTEGSAGAFYIEDRDQVRSWTLNFGILTQLALSREATINVFSEAMKGYG